MDLHFPGFEARDFEVFAIPDFAGRMGAIRARVKPKLAALGEDLEGAIAKAVGSSIFPHVAQHMRRRVNPPLETWVAFGRDKRGYKRWAHYRIAINAGGARVTVFVENDADDKPGLGEKLRDSGADLLRLLGSNGAVRWYTLEGEQGPVPITPQQLREEGARLTQLKTTKFQAGVPLPRGKAASLKPEQFEAWVMEQVTLLKPLYLAAIG